MIHKISEIGYCPGVKKAIRALKEASEEGQVYLLHPLMHNRAESEKLMRETGAEFLSDETNLSNEDIILGSAHGFTEAESDHYSKLCIVKSATCPVIQQRYDFLREYEDDISYFYLGSLKHQESVSLLSHHPFLIPIDISEDIAAQLKNLPIKPKSVVIPQTTISEDILHEFIELLKPLSRIVKTFEICPLYLSRSEESIKNLKDVEFENAVVFVFGDPSSSNCNQIRNSISKAYPNLETVIISDENDLANHEYSKLEIYCTSATSISEERISELLSKLN